MIKEEEKSKMTSIEKTNRVLYFILQCLAENGQIIVPSRYTAFFNQFIEGEITTVKLYDLIQAVDKLEKEEQNKQDKNKKIILK